AGPRGAPSWRLLASWIGLMIGGVRHGLAAIPEYLSDSPCRQSRMLDTVTVLESYGRSYDDDISSVSPRVPVPARRILWRRSVSACHSMHASRPGRTVWHLSTYSQCASISCPCSQTSSISAGSFPHNARSARIPD